MKLLPVIYLVLFLIPFSFAQKAKKLSPDSYVEWCHSQGFQWKGKDTAGVISYAVRFVPKAYDIAKCALAHCEKKEVLLEDLKELDNSFTFLLDMTCLEFSQDIFSIPSKTGMNTTDRKLYLSNYIKKDLFGLSASNDTIPCVSAVYEVTIPIRARVLFELEKTEKPITRIVFRDKMINNKPLEFEIPELTKKQVPTLNLKKYE